MHVERISMRNFMRHSNTRLDVPSCGVVLVTGINGSGKSTILEAVSHALWGKSLRGEPGWAEEGASIVTVSSDSVEVVRHRERGRTTLAWRKDGGDVQDFPTTTKSQEALESIVGSFDVWRRSCVFSSSDAAHFSTATDADRKRLLERFLGISAFDAALERCRARLKDVHSKLRATEAEVGRFETIRDEQQTQQKELEYHVGESSKGLTDDADDVRGKVEELAKMVARCDTDLQQTHLAIRREASLGGSLKERVSGLIQRYALIRDAAQCPTCGQEIVEETATALAAELQEARTRATQEADRARLVGESFTAQEDDLREERALLDNRREALASKVNEHDVSARHVRELEVSLAKLEAGLTQMGDKLDTARESTGTHARRIAVLEAAETVLGLKGVRAHLLSQALSGLEALAGAWLVRIAGAGYGLRVRPYSERKTGGVTDAISIEVRHPNRPDWHRYRSTSSGERRRFDVALVLGLAELAQSGRTGRATLFFDEVFDALDEDGIDGVAQALQDLAKTHSIVVISHSDALADRMQAAVHWRMEEGHLAV